MIYVLILTFVALAIINRKQLKPIPPEKHSPNTRQKDDHIYVMLPPIK